MSHFLRSAALAADREMGISAPERRPRRVGRPPIEDSLGLDDVIMPAQWFPDRAGHASLQPEKRLMLAVLSDAVDILVRRRVATDVRSRRILEETISWVDSDDRTWPFSFLEVCEALGLPPEGVRRGLARFRRPLAGVSRPAA